MGFELSVAQGIVGYQAGQSEKAQYEFNAKSEMIAADQDSAQRLSQLNGAISSVNAVRTSRGLDPASPTGLAIVQDYTKRAQQGIDTARFNYATQAQSDLFGAQQAQFKSDAALIGGFLHGAELLASGPKGGGG